jgi:hypothetical protein
MPEHVRWVPPSELSEHRPPNNYVNGFEYWEWGNRVAMIVDQTYFECDKNSSNLEFATLTHSWQKKTTLVKLTVAVLPDGKALSLGSSLNATDDRGNDNAMLHDLVNAHHVLHALIIWNHSVILPCQIENCGGAEWIKKVHAHFVTEGRWSQERPWLRQPGRP